MLSFHDFLRLFYLSRFSVALLQLSVSSSFMFHCCLLQCILLLFSLAWLPCVCSSWFSLSWCNCVLDCSLSRFSLSWVSLSCAALPCFKLKCRSQLGCILIICLGSSCSTVFVVLSVPASLGAPLVLVLSCTQEREEHCSQDGKEIWFWEPHRQFVCP